jgi:thiamine kinase-like enzyme
VSQSPDRDQIADLLHSTGIASGITADDLSVLSTKGISHDHWRIGNTGLLLRIPRMSQWSMEPKEALDYQQTAFRRGAASGHVPDCVDTLPPTLALPRGALIVQQVSGRAPRLPDDLPAVADALASLHGMAKPSDPDCAPLQLHRNPISSTLQVIEEQATSLSRARLPVETVSDIRDELEWARTLASKGEPEFGLCFVGTDTHPGNFLIDPDGKAWFVDLEKAVYGAAPIDLAHVTLMTSTGWDPDCSARLAPGDIVEFYLRYLGSVSRARAHELRPWLLPLRRLTWLRSITWFARWRAQWAEENRAATRDSAMTTHIQGHIDLSFQPETIAICRAEWLGPQALAF